MTTSVPGIASRRLATLAVLWLALTGCQDEQPLAARDDAQVTQRVTKRDARKDPRAHLRSTNPVEWVGMAHNQMIVDFRKELSRPGVLTNHACSYLTDFALHPARFPAGKSASDKARRDAARAGFRVNTLCNYPAPSGTFASTPMAPLTPPAPPAPDGSRLANALLEQIQLAVEQATTSYQLAALLADILEAAAPLDELEYTVIATTISVALNSYEYWDINYTSFERDVIDEYSPCAESQYGLGLSDDLVRQECLTGKRTVYDTSMPSTMSPGAVLMRDCPDAAAGIKSIIGSDIRGAFAGGLAGALTGGIAGAIGGALIGGGVGSTTRALDLAWQQLVCIFE